MNDLHDSLGVKWIDNGAAAIGGATRRTVGAMLRVGNATLRVGGATLRVVCATRRVVGATCRERGRCDAADFSALAPVVELEPASDGRSVDGDGEEYVFAPLCAVRLAGRVDVVHERDFCLAGLDVAQLVEDGYRLALVWAEFEFHRVARAEGEAASGSPSCISCFLRKRPLFTRLTSTWH